METNLERAVRLHDEFMELPLGEADAGEKLLDELGAVVALLTPGQLLDFLRETRSPPPDLSGLGEQEARRYRRACRLVETEA